MAASLPPEIVRLILQQLGHVSTVLEDYYSHGHDAYEKPAAQAARYAKTRTLLSACLVNRVWSKEAQALLYSNISCIQQDMLFGSAAMHSQEFAKTRRDFEESEFDMYDESMDGDDDDEFETYYQGGVYSQSQPDEAQSQDGPEAETGGEEPIEAEDSHSEEEASEVSDYGVDAWVRPHERNPGLSTRFSINSCSADISVRAQALLRTLSNSPNLASYVKTLSMYPESDTSMSILGYSVQVEEVCFTFKGRHPLNDRLEETLCKLERLKQCQLHRFPLVQTCRLLAALARSTSLEALRMSSFRWEADEDVLSSEGGKPYLQNVHSVLIDSAALPTAQFRALLRHLDNVSNPKKLDIRLHGISWAEEGDTYNPFGGLSKTTAESITAFMIRESTLENSDFRGLERLTSLRTLGIFGSHCGADFNGNLGGAVKLPESITTCELGRNELDSIDEDPPAVIPVVEAWLRQEKLPNLKTVVARPNDFAIMDFESMYYTETYEEIAEEIGTIRRKVESLQETLDAHKVDCKIRPVADFQRFLHHIQPLWNDSQPWTGLLQDRLEALRNSGIPYAFWKG